MTISYNKLWKLLIDKKMSSADLRKEVGIAPNTMTRLRKDEEVSLGGDCDTLAAIAGSIAEAFYGVPEALKEECRLRLPEDMRAVLERFDGYLKGT